MMKHMTLLAAALIVTNAATARTSRTAEAKLDEATVFFSGAELSYSVSVPLLPGENEIIVSGLSPRIDVNSVKISTGNGVVVSSYDFEADYRTTRTELTPALKRSQDSIGFYRLRIEDIDIRVDVAKQSRSFLMQAMNKSISDNEEPLGIEELARTLEYFGEKGTDFDREILALNNEKGRMEERIGQIEKLVREGTSEETETFGKITVSVTAATASTARLGISYFTPMASWVPYYDVTVESTAKPVVFNGKARVHQSTGIDWTNVRLSLSTAAPGNGKVAPLFTAWQLRPVQPTRDGSSTLQGRVTGVSAMQNSYSYEKSSVNLRGSGSSSSEPLVIIDGIPATMEELQALPPEMIQSIDVLKDAASTAVYGSRGSDGVLLVSLKNSIDDYVTRSDNMLSELYRIDLPHSIPGDGTSRNIDLGRKEATAEYKYYSVPKLDAETYLLAEIPGWEHLGLLSGAAHITYDGTYIGETRIDASATMAKLPLTLGTDRRISVKREQLLEFSSTRTIGSDIQRTFTYRITVRNNQSVPVRVVVKNQYPISTQRNIEVTLQKETTPGATNVESTGVLTWEDEFAPGETRIYDVSFTVKHPKEMNLNL